MKYAFGILAAILSLLCSAAVVLYMAGVAVSLREEKRAWGDYPMLFVEHWGETAIFLGVLLLGFVFLVISINLLRGRSREA